MTTDRHTAAAGDRPWSIELIDASFVVVASALTAVVVALAGFWLVPLRDPVEVVGNPLFLGYSERSEQFFCYLFILAALVMAGAATRWLRPASQRSGLGRGAPLILLLFAAAAVTIWLPLAVLSAFVPLLAAWLLGSSRVVGRQPSMGLILSLWLLTIALIVIHSMRHVLVEVCRDITSLVAVLVIVATIGVALRRQVRPAISRARELLSGFDDRFADRRPGVTLLIWLAAALVCIAPHQRLSFLAVATAAALGVSARKRYGPAVAWWSPQWIGLVVTAAALSCTQTVPFLDSWRRLLPSWGSLAIWPLAVVIGVYAGARLLGTAGGQPLTLPRSRWLRWGLLALLLVPFLRYMSVNAWTGCTLSIIVCALLLRRPRSTSFLTGLLLAIAILLAVVPVIELERSFDPAHDGQILSAVWELEHGSTLFSEVFPIRGYQFFLSLLSRRILPPTVQGLQVAQQLVTFLHLGGICALVFAWTRSGAWSFASAMLLLWSGYHRNETIDLASRQGVMLWIAALVIVFLRSRRPSRWLALVLAAVLSAAAGFDSYAALLPAIAASSLAGWYLSGRSSGQGFRDFRRLVVALAPVILVVVAPMALLCLWQGAESVRWFWTLLLESSRYYTAFFGLPIELTTQHTPLVLTGLLSMAVWATLGACFWSRMRGRKRVMWIFLLVFFLFVLHRGIGRSYWMWLQCVLQPALTMASLGAYELISFMRRRGRRGLGTDRSIIAIVAAAVLLWAAPVTLGGPLRTIEALWAMPRQQQLPLRVAGYVEDSFVDVDPYIAEMVPPDQPLWAVESSHLYFLSERHNPTRHALAVTSWPAENARMVEAMRRHPPVLIHFDHRSFRFQNLDNMPFTVRYYIVSQLVFSEYQPSQHPPFLIRATPQWQGFDETPDWLTWPFELVQLPATWGELRAPRLTPRSRQRLQPLPDDPTRDPGSQTAATSQSFAVDCSPRAFNYLLLRMTAASVSSDSRDSSLVTIEVASPGGAYDATSPISFELRADGVQADYLVPIGCSPAWSWRRHIDRLRVSSDQETAIQSTKIELWLVDEMDPYRR